MSAAPAQHQNKPLTPDERQSLLAWERRMKGGFLAWMIVLGVFLGLRVRFSDTQLIPMVILLLLMMAAGMIIQFSARCPRCCVRIGLYCRLRLPPRCPCCGVEFRPPGPLERRMGAQGHEEDE